MMKKVGYIAYPARLDNPWVSLSSWVPNWVDRLPITNFWSLWYHYTGNWTEIEIFEMAWKKSLYGIPAPSTQSCRDGYIREQPKTGCSTWLAEYICIEKPGWIIYYIFYILCYCKYQPTFCAFFLKQLLLSR